MNWFRNLFRQKKSLADIEAWISVELKKLDGEADLLFDSLSKEFPVLLTSVKDALSALEKAELRNPNVPERAKHFMLGNREQFVKLSLRFLDSLSVPKDGPDFSEVDLLFHQFSQNTGRPGAILSEFFGAEVKEVRKCISVIEAKILEAKKLNLRKDEFVHIGELIKSIKRVDSERVECEKQKAEFVSQLDVLNNKLASLRKEKEAFTSRDDYLKVKEDILSAVKERQDAERAITDLFSPLSDAIKKYAHKVKNDKLARYGDSPVDALVHDYSLGILKHVDFIRTSVVGGEIGLKPERVQKCLESLNLLSKESLSGMIHRFANAKKREADMHNDIASRPVMKEYEQYAEQIKLVNVEIKQLEDTISKIKEPSDVELKETLKRVLEERGIVLV